MMGVTIESRSERAQPSIHPIARLVRDNKANLDAIEIKSLEIKSNDASMDYIRKRYAEVFAIPLREMGVVRMHARDLVKIWAELVEYTNHIQSSFVTLVLLDRIEKKLGKDFEGLTEHFLTTTRFPESVLGNNDILLTTRQVVARFENTMKATRNVRINKGDGPGQYAKSSFQNDLKNGFYSVALRLLLD